MDLWIPEFVINGFTTESPIVNTSLTRPFQVNIYRRPGCRSKICGVQFLHRQLAPSQLCVSNPSNMQAIQFTYIELCECHIPPA